MAAVSQSNLEVQERESSDSSIGEVSLDGESSDEEEGEPKLKYARVEHDVVRILSREIATCLAVHMKFLALGTDWGMIHILDHQGNNICKKNLPSHTARVNQISIDDNGDYLASCSDDGRVVINGLYNSDHNQTISYNRPIKAVAIEPTFSRPNSSKTYVCGDDALALCERRGLLNRYHSTILHQGEGSIRNIQWKGSRFAWSNDSSVRIFDTELRCRISTICKDVKGLCPDLHPCRLFWKDDTSLLVGWGQRVRLAKVKEEKHAEKIVRSMYLAMTIDIEYYVCGISMLKNNIVLLTWSKPETENRNERAHMIVIEQPLCTNSADDYVVLSDEALSLRGYEAYRCTDYHLECLCDENTYYIVTPKDLVIAKERDMDDHVEWLLLNAKYEDAVMIAEQNSRELKKYSAQVVGEESIQKLIEDGDFEEAASLSYRILGNDKHQWSTIFYKFVELGHIKIIAPFVQRCDPQLSPDIYELILDDYLKTDINYFKVLLEEWPSHIYDVKSIIRMVNKKLGAESENRTLLECLARLYEHDKDFSRAVDIYLSLKNNMVFSVIEKHSLYSVIKNNLIKLFDLSSEKTSRLLLDSSHTLTVDEVVKQLEENKKYLHMYLHQLFVRDKEIGKTHHDKQIYLYAEFDRKEMLQFLRNSASYTLSTALKVCEDRNFNKEVVYLLNRMGNKKKALQVLMNKMKNVEEAIIFCKEENEKYLWEMLISNACDKAEFITSLLNNIGSHVDPIFIIRQIKGGMQIPGLRDSLVKLLQDYNLRINLRRGCRNILISDSISLFQKLNSLRRRSISVLDWKQCGVCSEIVIRTESTLLKDVILFNCRHVFHEECLQNQIIPYCVLCSSAQDAKEAQRSLLYC